MVFKSLKSNLENSHKATSYRFNGKEYDQETGNYYYGQRYYDPKLSIWLSVDRLAAKYPSHSPYNFVLNNPINFIDPNGDSVSYNKFQDWLNVTFNSILSKEFRQNLHELKQSDEMYVFNGSDNPSGGGHTSTDGDDIYINYSFNSKDRDAGSGKATSLLHETEHAIQFEHGEFGFRKDKSGTWQPSSYDLTDEMGAMRAGSHAPGTILTDHNGNNTFQGDMRGLGTNLSKQSVINSNAKIILGYYPPTSNYHALPQFRANNYTGTRLKDGQNFMRPHTPR